MRICEAEIKTGKHCRKKISAKNNWHCGIAGHPPNPPPHEVEQNNAAARQASLNAAGDLRFRDTEDGPALVVETLEKLPDGLDCFDPEVARQMALGRVTSDFTWAEDDTGFTPMELILRARMRIARYGHHPLAGVGQRPEMSKAALCEFVSLSDALMPFDPDGKRIVDENRLAYTEHFGYHGKEFQNTADRFAFFDASGAIDEMFPGRAVENTGLRTVTEFENHQNTTQEDVKAVLDAALMGRAYVDVGTAINRCLVNGEDIEQTAIAATRADAAGVLRTRVIGEWVVAAHANNSSETPFAFNKAFLAAIGERGTHKDHPICKHATRSQLGYIDRQWAARTGAGEDAEAVMDELMWHFADVVLTAKEQAKVRETAAEGSSLVAAAEKLDYI